MTEQIPIPTLYPTMQMLSEEQIKAIHYSSLDILARTGIVMKNAKGRELLLAAGAWEDGERIKIPERVVTQAIASAPPRIALHDRLGRQVMPLENGKVFFGPGSDCIFTMDVETGERRRTTAEDIRRIAQLCDGLDQIDFVMSMGNPCDVAADDIYIHEFISMIRGSSKPICYTANNRSDMELIYRIACGCVGGENALRERPFLILYAEPISPLLYTDESVDKLLFCAEVGIPTAYPPSPNAGGGGPITPAGAMALANAECLAGLVLTQLVRPGAPFLYGFNVAALDMRSTIVAYGAPEWSLTMAGCSDMARWYGLPVWGYAGSTDSKVVDAQAGMEATLSIMTAFLSRTNLVHDVGYIEYGSTSSMEMLVVCDEIIRYVRYVMGGIEVSERTLARETIHNAAPGAGFLASEHTLDNWKTAQWRPAMIDRLRFDTWNARGRKDMSERANARALKILAEHQPAPLPEMAEEAIRQALASRG